MTHMTGPEHYAEAERLLDESREPTGRLESYAVDLTLAAQVHATLALAAATARHAWIQVTS
jgi:hypothetical protein